MYCSELYMNVGSSSIFSVETLRPIDAIKYLLSIKITSLIITHLLLVIQNTTMFDIDRVLLYQIKRCLFTF